MSSLGDALDSLAGAVFWGVEGRARLAPLLDRYAREVGTWRDDDPDAVLLHAIRVDWALCDAVPSGAEVGLTWALRAARGELRGIEPTPEIRALAGSISGVFEVYPGSPAFVRDAVRGLVAPLRDPVEPPEPVAAAPAALWEARLLLEPGCARLCRRPLPYPLGLLPALSQLRAQFPVDPAAALQRLRRSRLAWVQRGRRGPPTLDPGGVHIGMKQSPTSS